MPLVADTLAVLPGKEESHDPISSHSGARYVGSYRIEVFVATLSLVLLGAFGLQLTGLRVSAVLAEQSVIRLDPAQVIFVRTPGGMLEAARMNRVEEFGWSSRYTCPWIDCPSLLKPTISRVRIRAHYIYQVPLAAEWKLELRDGTYELTVPDLKPLHPVAFETMSMDIETKREGWFSPPSGPNRENVVRHLGPELNRRSLQAHYVSAQREEAALRIQEFARKWMREQGISSTVAIRVKFGGGAGHAE
jgi:hypothetical protein